MSKGQTFIDYFLSHRNATKELITKIAPENYSYKPTPTSMETQKLVSHMLKSTYIFASLAAKQPPEELFTDEAPASLTEQEEVYTGRTQLLLESLSDEDFEEVIDVKEMLGSELTAGQLLQKAMDHEIHHKGQLFVYVRSLGHTDLPMFVVKQ